MQNRVFILALVVGIGIFIGVTITVQQMNNPLLRRMVQQQEEILKLQRRIEQKLIGSQAISGYLSQAAAQEGEFVPGPQLAIDQRLELVEEKLDGLIGLLTKPLRANAPQDFPSDEYTKIHKIDIAHSPIKGNKDALVTIVEFMDFQCPFCSRFHPVIEEVLNNYPAQVNYVLKNFPLQMHPQARPAAKASLAAGEQGKYWEMTELLLKNNYELSDEKFEQLAKDLGLDTEKFKNDYKEKDAQWDKMIQDDYQLGIAVEVRGTPTFYINGRKTSARDLGTFKKEIEEILNK